MSFREQLKPYEGERVKCRGIYDGQGTGGIPGRLTIRTCVFSEVTVTVDADAAIALDHVWVQNAGEILDEKPCRGDVIEFTAVVNKYWKRDPGCDAWGLMNPRDVVTEHSKTSQYRSPLLPPPVTKTKAEEPESYFDEPTVCSTQLEDKGGPSRPEPTAKEVIAAVKGILRGFSGEDHVPAKHLTATLEWVIQNSHNIEYTKGLVGGAEEFLELAEMLS